MTPATPVRTYLSFINNGKSRLLIVLVYSIPSKQQKCSFLWIHVSHIHPIWTSLHEQRTNINIAFLRPGNTIHSGKGKAGKDHRGLFKNSGMKDNEEGRGEAVSVMQFGKSLSISIFVKLPHKRGYATRVLSIALDISQ